MRKKIIYLILLLGLSCISGCKDDAKHLTAWQISKGQVEIIKNTIILEGYKRISEDNYHYEGALGTQYSKQLSQEGGVCEIIIMLSFKTVENTPDIYKNSGVSVWSQHKDIPEIKAEIERMENLLYKKLLELTGKDNVVKGWPRDRK